MWTADSALNLFRYNLPDQFDDGDVIGTNYWKIANQTRDWTMFVCGSFMFTTSLLDVLGFDSGITNLYSWYIFEWILDATLPFAYAMLFYTYDRAFDVANDTSKNATDQLKGEAVSVAVRSEILKNLAFDMSTHLTLDKHRASWTEAQFINLLKSGVSLDKGGDDGKSDSKGGSSKLLFTDELFFNF